jgi:multiple sugar transport system substrate-binding protein
MKRSSRITRRLAAVIGVAALAAGALTACSSSSGTSGKTITVISSWASGQPTGDEFAKNIKAFTKKTGIHVKVQSVNNDDVDKTFEASAVAHKEADIVVLNLTPSSADWLPNGLVVDTKKYLDEWGFKDEIQPAAIQYWTNKNGVNGIPFIGFNWPIWYNMSLFNKAGISKPPATFDQLISDSKKLRAAGIQPFVVGGKDWPAQNFITWMGQQYLNPKEAKDLFTNGDWCQPDVVKGLNLLTKMRDEGVFVDNVEGFNADQMTNQYFTGDAAMMPSGSWAYTSAPAAIAKVTTVSGFPVVKGGYYKSPTAYNGYSAGFFISKNGSKNIDAVKQLFQYMYQPSVLKGWVSNASQILDVTAATVQGAKGSAPLLIKGSALDAKNTSFLVLPDSFLPDNTDWSTIASAFLGEKGTTGSDLCKTLEATYKKI